MRDDLLDDGLVFGIVKVEHFLKVILQVHSLVPCEVHIVISHVNKRVAYVGLGPDLGPKQGLHESLLLNLIFSHFVSFLVNLMDRIKVNYLVLQTLLLLFALQCQFPPSAFFII